MSRCVIVGGAAIGDYETVCKHLKDDDFNIICDSGLVHLESLGIRPNLIVGDFDSHPNPQLDIETIVLPCEKDDTDKHAAIIDDYSEMEIVSNDPAFINDSFAYFSLLNISGLARKITVENAKYPLQNAEITCEYQYGVSNEVLPGKTAKVSVGEGSLLLIKVFRK